MAIWLLTSSYYVVQEHLVVPHHLGRLPKRADACLFIVWFSFLMPVCGKLRSWTGPNTLMVGSLPLERTDHVLVSVGGKIYVFGGFSKTATYLNDLHQYNPMAKEWTELSAFDLGGLPPPRASTCAASSSDNFYVFGGLGKEGKLQDLWKFDTSELKWNQPSANLYYLDPHPRMHCSLAYARGELFLFGGYSNWGYENDLWRFRFGSIQAWSIVRPSTADLPGVRSGATLTGISDTRLILLGGQNDNFRDDAWTFDLTSLRWTTAPSLPTKRAWHGVGLADDLLFVYGGRGNDIVDYPRDNVNDLWTINSSVIGYQWHPVYVTSDVNYRALSAKTKFGFTIVQKKIYLFGGSSYDIASNDFFQYDTTLQSSWRRQDIVANDNLPLPIAYHGFASVGAKLFKWGGAADAYYVSWNSVQDDLWSFDPATCLWTRLTVDGSAPMARCRFGFASLGSRLFVFGGVSTTTIFGDLWSVDVSNLQSRLSWTQHPSGGSVPPARYDLKLATVDDVIFSFGGISGYIYRDSLGTAVLLNDLYSFNTRTETWTLIHGVNAGGSGAPEGRYAFGFAALKEKLYVWGGYNAYGFGDNDLYQFDTKTNHWTNLRSVMIGKSPQRRNWPGFISAAGKIFLFGGWEYYAGEFNDLFQFDPTTMTWHEISKYDIKGIFPTARFGHGFAATQDRLLVFGGYKYNQGSAIYNDVWTLNLPYRYLWPLSNSPSEFIGIYDWDELYLPSGRTNILSITLNLCSFVFPCQMSIIGDESAQLQRHSKGSIDCLASNGCKQISLDSVNITCTDEESHIPLLRIEASTLTVSQSNFSGCFSSADGGIIQSYDNAAVYITGSIFHDIATSGFGGALTSVGSTVFISDCQFRNISSQKGGGGIWSTVYKCFGSPEVVNSEVTITFSHFDSCKSNGHGGAMMASNDLFASIGTVLVSIWRSTFLGCHSEQDGGALMASGDMIFVDVQSSVFKYCDAAGSGGAGSVQYSAQLSVSYSSFENNKAFGLGGGALHAQDAFTSLINIVSSDNAALHGGGGLLLWDGSIIPQIDSKSINVEKCAQINVAVYGSCLASTFKSLKVYDIPTEGSPAYAGLIFAIKAWKLDYYNQTITTDSASTLQVSAAKGIGDNSTEVTGNSIAVMQNGRVSFSVAVSVRVRLEVSNEKILPEFKRPQIYVEGTDISSKTIRSMRSDTVTIILRNGSDVCPKGYVLETKNDEQSVCSLCGYGTYSLDPLIGITLSKPSCLPCPSSATCTGGFEVRFSVGSWVASKGLYILAECPRGHQLIDSVDGVFSPFFQHCRQCNVDEYIVFTNSSKYSCNICPIGAKCNVSGLAGLVPGSTWILDLPSGKYKLTGCPAGFVIHTSTEQSQACSPWTATTYISFVVSSPISKDGFNSDMQSIFLNALSATASVPKDEVMIAAITPLRRSSLNLLQIESFVAAKNKAAGNNIMSNLTSSVFALQLQAQGFMTAAKVVSCKIITPDSGTTGPSTTVIAGSAVGGFVGFSFILLAVSLLMRRMWIESQKHAFVRAHQNVESGEVATNQHLPYEMRTDYVATKILGKGSFGSVVQAKKKVGGLLVAIKFIFPEQGTFRDEEIRQIRREEKVLHLFTTHRHEFAVLLAPGGTTNISANLCWFTMEALDGDNLATVIQHRNEEIINDLECIKIARSMLAALKIMHSEGIVHRDIKPANIMRCKSEKPGAVWDGKTYAYKLIDFGTSLGVDETLVSEVEVMMTLSTNRKMGAGTPPYMSPEMYTEPEKAHFPTDIWSLGVTLFELATGKLPFHAENELLWGPAIMGEMDKKAPNVLDVLGHSQRSVFDQQLANVIGKALEKHVPDRFQSTEEMHQAIYSCLVDRGDDFYSVFISYRAKSEAPLARLLFDDLNHSITPGGHRVTVYWDAFRLVKGENWETGFATGLLNSLCFFPLLSYGATAPMAEIPEGKAQASFLAMGWDERPVGRARLQGLESDAEDNVLKEFLIANTLLERRSNGTKTKSEKGILERIYPILVGRQEPPGHPKYPGMGSFFDLQGGGGKYPSRPSPPTNRAVTRFLAERANLPKDSLQVVEEKSVHSILNSITALQGCQLWNQSDLEGIPLCRQQREIIGTGCAGPAVSLGGVQLTNEQMKFCREGLDENQLKMLKAQVAKMRDHFHEVIDHAFAAHSGFSRMPSS